MGQRDEGVNKENAVGGLGSWTRGYHESRISERGNLIWPGVSHQVGIKFETNFPTALAA
jgi:hypothetical protein